MSTNKGVSSFDPRTQKFSNYTVADGLPGPDLTGWGACFKSAAGEMFFGGFSGVTAFFPDQVVADAVVANAFVPPIVLTDFRLFGRPVTLSPGSPLKKAVNYTDAITLSHSQNIFSIGFSALSYLMLRLTATATCWKDRTKSGMRWESDQRLASYTTLPTGTYMFHVQGASRRGPWSEPGAQLRIQILPPWWATRWFRITCLVLILLLVLCIPQIPSATNAFEISDMQEGNLSLRLEGDQEVTMSYERRCQVKKRPRGRTPHIFLDIQP